MRLSKLVLALALILPALAWADRDVTVIVDLSKAGRKLPKPDPAHLQYYRPLIGGYKEYGDPIPGMVPPSVHEVVHIVAKELLKRGYHVIDGSHPQPGLLLDISWGMLNPNDSDDTGNNNLHNEIERENLVLGHTITTVAPVESYNRDAYMEATHDERYFVILSAFDPAPVPPGKKPIGLWQAKMSVPLVGIAFADVLDKMVEAGAPQFGIETNGHPKLVSIVPEGHVEVGTAVVKPDPTAAPTPALTK